MPRLQAAHGYSREERDDGRVSWKNLYTCCHCQYTWEAETGSLGGELSGGFCGKCFGYICRNPDCLRACLPWEARLENVERGLVRLQPRPIKVSVPDLHFSLNRGGQLQARRTAIAAPAQSAAQKLWLPSGG